MSLRRGSALLVAVVLTACESGSRVASPVAAANAARISEVAPGVTTVMEDGSPADIGLGSLSADIVAVAQTSSIEAVGGQVSNLASDGSVRLLIAYPYGSNNGVPPLATLAANGITGTYLSGNVVNAAILANYDVLFIGRNSTISFLNPVHYNTADVVAWINGGGTVVGETNSVGFDSDAWMGANISSTMRGIFGISTPNSGGDCGQSVLPVTVNTSHPLAAGLPASFSINVGPGGSFLAWQCGSGLNPASNPTVVAWGNVNGQPLTTSTYGAGCTVWLPALGFANMNWAAQPNAQQMYLNALHGCGASSAPSDDTPPVITPNVSGTLGTNGWYTSSVNVTWTVTDDESSVSSTSGCDPVTLSADTPDVTLTCTATSDGGTASQSVSVKIDQTAPSVALTGNAGSYTVDQTVGIGCSISDNLSGLASQTCNGASGDAYTFGLGAHAVSASATDNAGNNASASGSFTVTVTAGSLCNLVNAWVTQHGIANSMCQQLANGAYGAFRNHLKAQTNKSVDAAKAEILRVLSLSL